MALTNINTDTLNNVTSTGASKLDSAKDAKTKAADDAKKAKQKAIDDAKDAKKKAKDAIKKQKDAIKKQKDEALKKAKDAKKAFDDKVAYLKDQKKSSTKDKKKKLLALITPLLAAFFASQVAIDALISAALKLVKNKLKGKGNVTITGYAIVFVPTVSGDYMSLKTNFDKRLNSIKTVIKTLKESITLLNNIIRVLLAIITVIRLYIFIKQKILIARLKAASVDLAKPTKSKPLTAAQLEKILTSIQNLEDTKKELDNAQDVLASATAFLTVITLTLNSLQNKLNQISFTIITPTGNISSTPMMGLVQNIAPGEEEYVNSLGKTYTLKLVTLPNKFKQYQALDSFSKLKITQTAPSKLKSDGDLLIEIKQILG